MCFHHHTAFSLALCKESDFFIVSNWVLWSAKIIRWKNFFLLLLQCVKWSLGDVSCNSFFPEISLLKRGKETKSNRMSSAPRSNDSVSLHIITSWDSKELGNGLTGCSTKVRRGCDHAQICPRQSCSAHASLAAAARGAHRLPCTSLSDNPNYPCFLSSVMVSSEIHILFLDEGL